MDTILVRSQGDKMIRKTLVAFTLLFLFLITIRLWPMEYRAFEYRRQQGAAYGFEGRKWLVGEWQKIGYGADSWQEAEKWILMQPKR